MSWDEVRELLLARSSEQAILKAARDSGMSTLREQCLQRVREGVTTLEEVARTAVFLASDDASAITASAVNISCGLMPT